MVSDRHASYDEEPRRVMGIPVRDHGAQARRGEEPRRVMGFPVDPFGPEPADLEWLRSLAHPIRMYKRWVRHRRLGPYATDEDEP